MELSDINLSLSDAVSICEGIVSRAGKFEGQPSIAPYLHHLSLDGEGEHLATLDENGYSAIWMGLTEKEAEAFGLEYTSAIVDGKEHQHAYVLSEDANGFCSAVTLNAYREWEHKQFIEDAIWRQNNA